VTVYEAAPSQASLSCPTARSPDLGQQARSSYRGVISPIRAATAGKCGKGLTRWEHLGSWITPSDNFFSIAHYNRPEIVPMAWRLDVWRPAPLEICLTWSSHSMWDGNTYRESYLQNYRRACGNSLPG